ncbi:hypothetical protein ACFQPA_06895 [Halomarina halobia]|nr:hypothetical protein [Halomarina sp. PSR21]
MTRRSKRTLEQRLGELEGQVTTEGDRLETLAGDALMYADEPALTDYLVSLGFVVEREERVHSTGHEDVMVHTTPSASDVFHSVRWHSDGPTTPHDACRIAWADDRLEAVLATAEHPVEYDTPELPIDSVTVDEGDGWRAIAPAGHVVENMVLRRSAAENYGYKILGPVPSRIADADELDLVEVDAVPVPYADRRPTPPHA